MHKNIISANKERFGANAKKRSLQTHHISVNRTDIFCNSDLDRLLDPVLGADDLGVNS